jgi:hypothetical protein
MDQTTLGIGTRLQHTQFGPGVIVGVKYAVYQVSFIHHGIKEIDKNDPHLDEIIPENVTEEIETHAEVERSLLKILRLWNGFSEIVPLGDKWKGGTELRPQHRWGLVRNLRYARLSSNRPTNP